MPTTTRVCDTDGAVNNWATLVGASVHAALSSDNADTSYLATGASEATAEGYVTTKDSTLVIPQNAIIVYLQMTFKARDTNATYANGAVGSYFRIGGVNYYIGDLQTPMLTTYQTLTGVAQYASPATGKRWTATEVNAMEWGAYGISGTDVIGIDLDHLDPDILPVIHYYPLRLTYMTLTIVYWNAGRLITTRTLSINPLPARMAVHAISSDVASKGWYVQFYCDSSFNIYYKTSLDGIRWSDEFDTGKDKGSSWADSWNVFAYGSTIWLCYCDGTDSYIQPYTAPATTSLTGQLTAGTATKILTGTKWANFGMAFDIVNSRLYVLINGYATTYKNWLMYAATPWTSWTTVVNGEAPIRNNVVELIDCTYCYDNSTGTYYIMCVLDDYYETTLHYKKWNLTTGAWVEAGWTDVGVKHANERGNIFSLSTCREVNADFPMACLSYIDSAVTAHAMQSLYWDQATWNDWLSDTATGLKPSLTCQYTNEGRQTIEFFVRDSDKEICYRRGSIPYFLLDQIEWQYYRGIINPNHIVSCGGNYADTSCGAIGLTMYSSAPVFLYFDVLPASEQVDTTTQAFQAYGDSVFAYRTPAGDMFYYLVYVGQVGGNNYIMYKMSRNGMDWGAATQFSTSIVQSNTFDADLINTGSAGYLTILYLIETAAGSPHTVGGKFRIGTINNSTGALTLGTETTVGPTAAYAGAAGWYCDIAHSKDLTKSYLLTELYNASGHSTTYSVHINSAPAGSTTLTEVLSENCTTAGHQCGFNMCAHPTDNDGIMVIKGDYADNHYHYQLWDGASWGGWTDVGAGTQNAYKVGNFEVKYSRDAVKAYFVYNSASSAASHVHIDVFNGSSWAGATHPYDSSTTLMFPRIDFFDYKGADYIVFIAALSTYDNVACAYSPTASLSWTTTPDFIGISCTSGGLSFMDGDGMSQNADMDFIFFEQVDDTNGDIWVATGHLLNGGFTVTYSLDVVLKALNTTKIYSLDTVFKAMNTTKTYLIDEVQKELNRIVPQSGCVFWMPLDDDTSGQGTTMRNKVVGASDGTNSGATWVAGHVGTGALSFDGTDDTATVTSPPNPEDAITIIFWIKAGASSGSVPYKQRDVPILTKSGAYRLNRGYNYPQYLYATLYFTDGSFSQYTPWTELVEGNWYMVTCTYDSTTGEIRVYLDNDYTTSMWVSKAKLQTNANNLVFGGAGRDGDYMADTLDEVMIFNRALTATEIAAIRANGMPSYLLDVVTKALDTTKTYLLDSVFQEKDRIVPLSGCLLWMPMDEGEVPSSGTVVYDKSGNSRNGTLVGASWCNGYAGGGIFLDGDNNKITIADMPTTGYRTVMLWYKTTDVSTNNAGIFYSTTQAGNAFTWCKQGANDWQVYVAASNGKSYRFRYVTPDDSNEWVHDAFVFNDTTHQLLWYRNGELLTTLDSDYNTDLVEDSGMTIGYAWDYWCGMIDEVAMFDRPLTETEIAAIYNSGMPSYLLDVIFSLSTTKTYVLDAVFKALNTTKPYLLDVVFKRLNDTSPYTLDIVIKLLDVLKTYPLDVVFKRTDDLKTYLTDVVFKRIDITPYLLDVVFKRRNVSKQFKLDVLFKKTGTLLSYLLDTRLIKRYTQTYSVDTTIKKIATSNYSIDTLILNAIVLDYVLERAKINRIITAVSDFVDTTPNIQTGIWSKKKTLMSLTARVDDLTFYKLLQTKGGWATIYDGYNNFTAYVTKVEGGADSDPNRPWIVILDFIVFISDESD